MENKVAVELQLSAMLHQLWHMLTWSGQNHTENLPGETEITRKGFNINKKKSFLVFILLCF